MLFCLILQLKLGILRVRRIKSFADCIPNLNIKILILYFVKNTMKWLDGIFLCYVYFNTIKETMNTITSIIVIKYKMI